MLDSNEIQAVIKLKNWGRIEAHKRNQSGDLLASNSAVPVTSTRSGPGSKPEGGEADRIPAMLTDAWDIDLALDSFGADGRLRRLLYWRFAEERSTDLFRDPEAESQIRAADDKTRPDFRKAWQEAFERMVGEFVGYVAQNIENEIF